MSCLRSQRILGTQKTVHVALVQMENEWHSYEALIYGPDSDNSKRRISLRFCNILHLV